MNGRFSNELLVTSDGRSVYVPTFGGVFCDVVDLALEDIERIEVIRRPGGSVWGANAAKASYFVDHVGLSGGFLQATSPLAPKLWTNCSPSKSLPAKNLRRCLCRPAASRPRPEPFSCGRLQFAFY